MTVIDMRIEPLVRETFAGMIGEEPDRLDGALQKISDLPDADKLHALRIASGILYVVLYRMENRRPTPEEVSAAAAAVVRVESSWLPLRQEDVETILMAHVELRDLSLLQPAETVASLLFMVTGSLISMCAPAERHWADFLDECENMLDSMYGQGPLAQS